MSKPTRSWQFATQEATPRCSCHTSQLLDVPVSIAMGWLLSNIGAEALGWMARSSSAISGLTKL